MTEFTITSLPGASDSLDLDPDTIPYAGKFGRRSTGTAVLRGDSEILGAIAFSSDRSDWTCCRIRYIAVHRDRQNEGIAGRLIAAFVTWALATGYTSIRITVLNPFAIGALVDGGFGDTGESGPAGGVVLEYPGDPSSIVQAMVRLDHSSLTDEQRRYVKRYLDEDETAGELP